MFHFKQFSLASGCSLNIKTVLFKVIQFRISTLFSSMWLTDRTLSGALTPSESGPGSNGNEEMFCIPQSSSITGTSPLDCLVSYPGHWLRESYPSAEVQFYSPSRLGCRALFGEVLHICRSAIGVFYCPSRLGHRTQVGVGCYTSAEVQSVYSTTEADWASTYIKWVHKRISICMIE